MRQSGRGAGWPSVRARCVRRCTRPGRPLRSSNSSTMTDWSLLEHEWPAPPPMPHDPYRYPEYDPYYQKKQHPMDALMPPQAHHFLAPQPVPVPVAAPYVPALPPKMDSPREIRNKAEKQRRDRMNRSIAELAAIVPQVVAASRKIDKTSVLRLTAHFIRTDYVFEPPHRSEFATASVLALLRLLKGFLISVTYKGLIVVVSHNVNEYLGYTELELLGQNVINIVHEEDRHIIREQLMPTSQKLGRHGEIIVPDDEAERSKMAQLLANEKRSFVVRFKKLGQRSEPSKYVTCQIQGSFKMSERALRGKARAGGCHVIRRARARGDNPCSSGNDVVFIGIACPTTETFINESALESYRMEYRTRHSIDGEIIQCEQRIAMVTGYMMNEVSGINAMNFIHRDEVRWVVFALKEMYDNNQLFGESCYRLMMRNGQFIYMRTRGRLDVDSQSRAVTSFVCTNTVVDEKEGKHLIKLMKERYHLKVDNNEQTLNEDAQNADIGPSVPVENPRLLEKVILNMVTNLPSPESEAITTNELPSGGSSPSQRLAIIAPNKERILSAIERIYTVIKTIPKQPTVYDSLCPAYADIRELGSCDAIQGTDTGLNSETGFSPNSEVEYIPKSVYDDITPIKIGNAQDVNKMMQSDFDFQSPPMPALGSPNYDYREHFDLPPDTNTVRMKRSRKCEDEVTTKKKIIDAIDSKAELKKSSGRESPALEALFDEKELNAEIESAMNMMDTIDPNFFDMLISNEVPALETINGEPVENQPNVI